MTYFIFHSFIHCLPYLFILSFSIHSLGYIIRFILLFLHHSFIHKYIYCLFVHSLFHCSFIHPSIDTSIHFSLVCSFIHSILTPFIHLVLYIIIDSFLHNSFIHKCIFYFVISFSTVHPSIHSFINASIIYSFISPFSFASIILII